LAILQLTKFSDFDDDCEKRIDNLTGNKRSRIT